MSLSRRCVVCTFLRLYSLQHEFYTTLVLQIQLNFTSKKMQFDTNTYEISNEYSEDYLEHMTNEILRNVVYLYRNGTK